MGAQDRTQRLRNLMGSGLVIRCAPLNGPASGDSNNAVRSRVANTEAKRFVMQLQWEG